MSDAKEIRAAAIKEAAALLVKEVGNGHLHCCLGDDMCKPGLEAAHWIMELLEEEPTEPNLVEKYLEKIK